MIGPNRVRATCGSVAVVVAALIGGAIPAPQAATSSPAVAPVRAVPAVGGPAGEAVAPGVSAAAVPLRYDRLSVFGGLGAWIDLYDYATLDARRTTRALARKGVRTVYVQTGWPSTPDAVVDAAGDWLVEGHRAGMRVVGWYLPHYADLEHDARRTIAIARYRRGSHRFDGLGIDVEFRAAVPDRDRWMARVAQHARTVRRALPDYPIASIPPTPLQMAVAPDWWLGFPWREIASNADAIMLMSYWSDRAGCPRIKRHCAYEFTVRNVELTRELSGIPAMPIHIIGGVGDAISTGELKDFVRAALDAGADGASIYDVATTRPSWWSRLRRLEPLGSAPFGGLPPLPR